LFCKILKHLERSRRKKRFFIPRPGATLLHLVKTNIKVHPRPGNKQTFSLSTQTCANVVYTARLVVAIAASSPTSGASSTVVKGAILVTNVREVATIISSVLLGEMILTKLPSVRHLVNFGLSVTSRKVLAELSTMRYLGDVHCFGYHLVSYI
jgi:hypothetical protein